jgi:hypothetical protein
VKWKLLGKTDKRTSFPTLEKADHYAKALRTDNRHSDVEIVEQFATLFRVPCGDRTANSLGQHLVALGMDEWRYGAGREMIVSGMAELSAQGQTKKDGSHSQDKHK